MSLAQHLIQDLIDEMFMNKNICKKNQKKTKKKKNLNIRGTIKEICILY